MLPADYEAEYASRGKNPQEEFFSPFNLLDPDPARKEQVYCAQHISFGAYHAGIVCNDIATDYPFVPVPQSQRDVLNELKDRLLKIWKELDTQQNEQMKALW